MPTYKLTYFNVDGGRGEPARIAFHAAKIPFEDNRLTFPQFGETRLSLPFHCVPVLEIDGVVVTQSNAINAYVGKLAGLYPEDPMQALYCDEVMGACEDQSHHVGATFGLEGDAMKEAREKLVERRLKPFLAGLAGLLERGGGEWFADHKLTVADLKVFVSVRSLTSGMLDHVPTNIVKEVAPTLVAHHDRVASDERVASYYASRK